MTHAVSVVLITFYLPVDLLLFTVKRGFRRQSTTEEMIRCRNFRRQSSQSDDTSRYVSFSSLL